MDVSGWTLAERMVLPDWCFGSRTLIGVFVVNTVIGSREYGISDIALPDPACIWEFTYLAEETAGNTGNYRAALANDLPANEAEMDAAMEFYPHYGIPRAGPNLLLRASQLTTYIVVSNRLGIVTGGRKLVVENHCVAGTSRIQVSLLVSTLPNQVNSAFNPKIA